jgi:hypothetical protein
VFVVSTKVSKQIANMAAAITKDIFMRLAPSKTTLYNFSAHFPEAVWLPV